MKKVSLFTLSFLLFAGFAFIAPFMVLYYQRLGFGGTEIGLLAGLAPLVTLFSAPLWTGLADATRRHRLLMSLTLLGGAIAVFSFSLFDTFAIILVIALLFSACYAPVSSFADSATLFMLADEKEMYGRIRLGGTIGFGLAAPVAGVLVQNYGLSIAFRVCALLLLLAFVVSQNLVYGQSKTGASTREGMRALLTNRRWRLFLTLAFAGGVAIAATNTYLFAYLKELGAPETTMGLTLTVGTFSEIPVFFFGDRLLRRLKPHGLLTLAMSITGLRLMLFGLAATPNVILWLQLFNGLTFPAMWVAGVAYADENAPAGLNTTAQGLFGAMVFGFGSAVGGFVGGPILENWGGHSLYLIFGAVVLAAVGLVTLIQHHLPVEAT
jgi:MFS transporter, PPP family, 3-phenylpropionic acid transporter